MPELRGLPGTDGTAIECAFFNSPSGAIRVLRTGIAATAANDNGAINVWIDDAGKYRCERMCFMSTKDSGEFSTQREVREWLKDALPKIQ